MDSKANSDWFWNDTGRDAAFTEGPAKFFLMVLCLVFLWLLVSAWCVHLELKKGWNNVSHTEDGGLCLQSTPFSSVKQEADLVILMLRMDPLLNSLLYLSNRFKEIDELKTSIHSFCPPFAPRKRYCIRLINAILLMRFSCKVGENLWQIQYYADAFFQSQCTVSTKARIFMNCIMWIWGTIYIYFKLRLLASSWFWLLAMFL